jgi:beta-glucosidase
LRVEPGGEVSVRIRNCGGRRGKEVVQLYVGSEDPGRPPLELKAFRCCELEAGAEGELTFTLGEPRVPGPYQIAVGSSSRVLPLTARVTHPAEPVAL